LQGRRSAAPTRGALTHRAERRNRPSSRQASSLSKHDRAAIDAPRAGDPRIAFGDRHGDVPEAIVGDPYLAGGTLKMQFIFANHTLGTHRRELHRGPTPIAVEPQVFGLRIVQNRDRVVSRDDLKGRFGAAGSFRIRLSPAASTRQGGRSATTARSKGSFAPSRARASASSVPCARGHRRRARPVMPANFRRPLVSPCRDPTCPQSPSFPSST
jgi:hypothetical protein